MESAVPTSLPLKPRTMDLSNDAHKLEEKGFEDFATGKYYSVRIGDILASKYQVVGKLGFGVSSTIWLARDLM